MNTSIKSGLLPGSGGGAVEQQEDHAPGAVGDMLHDGADLYNQVLCENLCEKSFPKFAKMG